MKYKLYDILTLEDNNDYCIAKMLQKSGEYYFLLNMLENEEATDEFRIVKYVSEGADEYIEGIDSSELLEGLKEEFSKLILADEEEV